MAVVKLTAPQRAALAVLASPQVRGRGGTCEGWKRRSTFAPIPRVNYLAARSLCDLGLARTEMAPPWRWSPYTHDDRYRITDAGRAALRP